MNSIRLTPVEQPRGGIGRIEPLLLPRLDGLYSRRASRLRALAESHAMADYLNFAARIAAAQQRSLERAPLPAAVGKELAAGDGAPLDALRLPRAPHWQQVLHGLADELLGDATPPVRKVLEGLREQSPAQLETLADALLGGRHAEVGSDRALFLWSALSLYWTQLAARLPLHAIAGPGGQRQLCPVCAQSPAVSVIIDGLRYLHCGLCESRWHMVRATCNNCEHTGPLDYWSLDSENATIKAESCNECESYLKVLYLDRDHQLEAIADDLASLALDADVERQGFARSGLNPFLLPG